MHPWIGHIPRQQPIPRSGRLVRIHIPQRQQQLKTHLRIRIVRHRNEVLFEKRRALGFVKEFRKPNRLGAYAGMRVRQRRAQRVRRQRPGPVQRPEGMQAGQRAGVFPRHARQRRRNRRRLPVHEQPLGMRPPPPVRVSQQVRQRAIGQAAHVHSVQPVGGGRPLRGDAIHAPPVGAVVQLPGGNGRLVHPFGMLHDLPIIIHYVQRPVRPHVRIDRTEPAVRRRQELFAFVQRAGGERRPGVLCHVGAHQVMHRFGNERYPVERFGKGAARIIRRAGRRREHAAVGKQLMLRVDGNGIHDRRIVRAGRIRCRRAHRQSGISAQIPRRQDLVVLTPRIVNQKVPSPGVERVPELRSRGQRLERPRIRTKPDVAPAGVASQRGDVRAVGNMHGAA